MVTPEYADQQAQTVFNDFEPYITGDPDAVKQLLCASAFLRCSDMQVCLKTEEKLGSKNEN